MPVEIKELVIRTFFGGMNYENPDGDDHKKKKADKANTSTGTAGGANSYELKAELKKILEQNQER